MFLAKQKFVTFIAVAALSLSGCVQQSASHRSAADAGTAATDSAFKNHLRATVDQCIVSLCGDGAFDPPVKEAEKSSAEKHFRRQWGETYPSLIIRASEIKAGADRKVAPFIQTMFAKPEQKYTSVQTALIAGFSLFEAMNASGPAIVPALRGREEKMETDYFEKLFANSGGEALAVPMHLLAERIFLPYWHKLASYDPSNQNSFRARMESLYPNKQLAEALRIDAKDIFEKIAAIKTKTGLEGLRLVEMTESYFQIIEKATAGKELTSYEKQIYVRRAMRVNAIALALRPENRATFKFPISWREFLVNRVGERLEILKANDHYIGSSAIKRTLASCEAGFVATTGPIVSKAELLPRIQAAKAAAKKVLQAEYSKDALRIQSVSRAIDLAEFDLADRSEERLEALRIDLEELIYTSLSSASAFQESTNPEWTAFIELLARASFDAQSSDDLNLIERACRNRSDMNTEGVTDDGKIRINSYQASMPNHTVPLVAHRLAHVIADGLRKSKAPNETSDFFKHLTCVSDRNPYDLTNFVKTKIENTLYSEEDIVDSISARIAKRMKAEKHLNRNEEQILVCQPILNREGKYAGRPTVQPSSDDRLSPGFMRSLFISTDLSTPISGICESLVESVGRVARGPATCAAPSKELDGKRGISI